LAVTHNNKSVLNWQTSFNKGKSNLAKGDIARLITSYAKEILSISSVLSCHIMFGSYCEGRSGRRGSAMMLFERAMVVSYRLSIVTIALSLTVRPKFTVECLRRSNQQGVCHFAATFGEEELDRYEPNFNTICERYVAVVRKKIVHIVCSLKFEHNAWTWPTERQTNRQTTER